MSDAPRQTLRQLFMIGTDASRQTNFIEDLPYEQAIYHQTGLARRVLMSVSAQDLQRRAGYIPLITTQPLLEKSSTEPTRTCNAAVMTYLFLMLNGHYPVVLIECLREITRTHQHVRAEGVMPLLLLGNIRNDLRALIKSAVGERGLWLAAQMSQREQHWLSQTRTIHDNLNAARQREKRTIQRLETHKNKLDIIKTLARHRHLWSDMLTNAFLKALDTHLQRYPPDNSLRELLLEIAPYYPPQHSTHLLAMMSEHATDYQAWHVAIETLQPLLAFRERLLTAIYDDLSA